MNFGSLGSLSNSGGPSAISDLGLGGSMTPDEEEERRRKLMAAAGDQSNPLSDLGMSAAASSFMSQRSRAMGY